MESYCQEVDGTGAAALNSSYSCAKSSAACKRSPKITDSRVGSGFRECRRSADRHTNLTGQICFLMNHKSGNGHSLSSSDNINYKSHWTFVKKTALFMKGVPVHQAGM